MERALKVITLDIKKKKFLRNLLISLFTMAGISFLNYIVLSKYEMCRIEDIPSMILNTIPFVILAISSFSLNQEFSNKTDKMIFTGVFSRNEIMISKLMSFVFASIICFAFYEIICIICKTFNLDILLDNLYAFIVYAFTLGSFILLVSAITSNFIVTGIIGYVLYFDLILALFGQALASRGNEMLKKVIEKLPFYIANTGFYAGTYTTHQLIILISCGILFLGIACVIINRKNI